jgi:hypothetical protein
MEKHCKHLTHETTRSGGFSFARTTDRYLHLLKKGLHCACANLGMTTTTTMQETLDLILAKLTELQAQVAALPQRKGRKASTPVDLAVLEQRKAKARAYMKSYQATRRAKAKAAANGSAQIAA